MGPVALLIQHTGKTRKFMADRIAHICGFLALGITWHQPREKQEKMYSRVRFNVKLRPYRNMDSQYTEKTS